MKPFVTIGIPTYNVGRFVALSIKSVLAQTYTNYELIITDDGSTDSTVEEIRKFDDPRIKLIVDSENHGISYRLNQQIDMAQGDFFVRMDGDDLMFPTRVEEQVKYLLEHPNVDVVGTGAVIIDDDNQIIGRRLSPPIIAKRPEDIINNTPFIHPTVCGRISFFRKYRYDEKLCGVEDNDLWLRGVTTSKYDMIQTPLMFYRDPLKFKLKTYTRRKIAGCKKVNLRWGMLEKKGAAIKYYIDALKKIVGAYILCKFGLESIFIDNRNNKDFDISQYTKILHKIIDKNE